MSIFHITKPFLMSSFLLTHNIISIIPHRTLFFIIDIFYPSDEPISSHLLCCGPVVVDDHNFLGRRLASAATSARE
jgi:hypothetical protein